MKRTVKRMVTIATSIITMASMLTGLTANAAVTYSKLTYTAGNVDGIVGSAEVCFDKVNNTTFDAATASRFSRKGYTVASWNVPSTGETVQLGAQYKMPSHDITFVANWKEAEYAVSFAGKGGKTEAGKANLTDKATYGTSMTLPECEFIYNGYTFAGWKYDGTVYNTGDEFEVPALLSGSKIVFAAVWTEEAEEAPVTTTAAATTTTEETTTTAATTVETEEAEEDIFTETSENVSYEAEEETTTVTTATAVEETTEETTVTTTTAAEDEEEIEEVTNYIVINEYISSETTVAADEETEETTVSFDYNNDGIVDSDDAEALRKFMVGMIVEGFEINAENADVNGDGMINVFDYMALSRICG